VTNALYLAGGKRASRFLWSPEKPRPSRACRCRRGSRVVLLQSADCEVVYFTHDGRRSRRTP